MFLFFYKDIVHRDLKLENILIKEFNPNTNTFFIKVTDFGLSSQRETAGTESMFEDYCGTPLYMGNISNLFNKKCFSFLFYDDLF